jgi:hypothetical protein
MGGVNSLIAGRPGGFQTSGMLEDASAEESVDLHLTVEEAEALARAAAGGQVKDQRQKAILKEGDIEFIDSSLWEEARPRVNLRYGRMGDGSPHR